MNRAAGPSAGLAQQGSQVLGLLQRSLERLLNLLQCLWLRCLLLCWHLLRLLLLSGWLLMQLPGPRYLPQLDAPPSLMQVARQLCRGGRANRQHGHSVSKGRHTPKQLNKHRFAL
jgi:hypothetical protein